MNFAHLHVHTEYSLLDGSNKIKEYVARVKELGMTAAAITDHGVMYGVIDFYRAARAAGINPVLGCEVYVAPGSRFDKTAVGRDEDRYYHLVLLAENNTGYANLMKIVSRAFTEGYYYKPRVDYELLETYHEGIIALSACLAGEVQRNLARGMYEEGKKAALHYEQIFGKGNFFLELQDHGIPEQRTVNQQLMRLSQEIGIDLVATNDVHYTYAEDEKPHDILLCLQTGKKLADEDRMRYEGGQYYVKSKEEMAALFPYAPEALENTQKIADRCHVEIEFGVTKLPKFDVPEGFTSWEYLNKLCFDGLKRRYGEDPDPALVERLNYELGVIKSMGYVDYFLIVWDFIHFAKSNGIMVGPGRGSAAGSIVAYTLAITNIDPIRYQLLFERFLNPERVSMPDFDVDFCQNNRGRVIEYVKSKYGEESVSQIATFGTMGAKGVIKDVGRVLDMSYSEADRLSRMIPTRPGHNTTLEEALSEEPQFRAEVRNNPQARKLIEYALKLEGTTRSLGIHAGGVLIAPGKLIDFCPLYAAGMLPENVISMYDKKDVEAVGLVKFDFLGLTTLTIIERALDYIGKNAGVRPDIEHMECDDEDTYKKIFQTGDTVAVFQFESPGMHKLLIDAKPTQLSDLIALNALYRPGPMDLIPDFLDIRAGRKKAEYADPRLIPILEDTAGIMVYQEQVMLVAQKIGGYSLGGADILRRAMGKKDVAEMERQSKVFIEGAAKNGVSEEVATHLFELMRKFAGYGFNKSHAAAYSYVAYKTGWLKNYYPAEFLASSLSEVMTDPEKSLKILMDAKRHGVKLLGPDINESEFNYTSPKTMEIRMGLGALKGVGSAPAEAIKAERDKNGPFKDPFDLVKRVGSQLITKKIIQVFAMAGVFDSIEPNRRKWFENADVVVQSAQENEKAADQFSLFGEEPSNEVPIKEVASWSERTRMEKEQYVLGFYFSGHPLEAYHSGLKRNFGAVFAGTESENPGEYLVAGMYIGCEQRRGKDGSPFVTLHLATPDGPVDYSVKNQYFEQERARIKEIPKGEIVVVELKKSHSKKSGKTWASPGAFYPLYELRHRQKAHIVIRPAEEADPKELERLILDVQMTHPEEAIRVDFEFSDDRSFRVRLPCPYKAAADWTLVRDLEDSPSIQQVEVAYGL